MLSPINKYNYLKHNLARKYRRIIIQMHLFRLRKAQQGLLNTATKFNNLGYCYEVVGGSTIQ